MEEHQRSAKQCCSASAWGQGCVASSGAGEGLGINSLFWCGWAEKFCYGLGWANMEVMMMEEGAEMTAVTEEYADG